MKHLFTILLSLSLFSISSAQDVGIVARTPSVSPDGNHIAFSYQGDIWVADSDGKNSKRLTIHEAYESNPVWSPAGAEIAFSGNRYGNDDIFVISVNGGAARRVTHHSASDLVTDWTTQGDLIFSTARLFRQVERDPEVHMVPAVGGTPKRFLNSFGSDPKVSPNGRLVAHTRGNARVSREAYDGPADRDIWIYDTQTDTYHEITDNSIQDFMPVWGSDESLYFISALPGRYNIYRMTVNSDGTMASEPEALTTFTDEGVRHMDVSKDDRIIVFEKDTHLYSIGTDGDELRTLSPDVTTDDRFDPIEYRTFTDDVDDFTVSPNGDLISMTIRGEIFVMENDEENAATVNVSAHSFRDRNASWINDSTVIFSSDRNGQYDLYMARSSDPTKTDIYRSLRHEVVRLTDTPEDEIEFVMSHDNKKIAYVVGLGTLITADIDERGSLRNKKTLLDGWDTPSGISWSPDNKWLAYSLADLNFDNEIYIHAADNSMKPVNVSMHPKSDYSPVWSKDGSKLGFISNRNNQDYDLWFVWLTQEEFEKTKREREDGYYFDNGAADKKGDDIHIDFDQIHERLYQLTFLPGNEGNMVISEDGETFFFSSSDPDVSGSDIYSVKFDRSDLKQVTKGGQNISGLRLSHDGKELMGNRRGRIVMVNPGSGKVTNLPFRAQMTINHALEREQILEEAWRELDKGFYDPEFHGRDWKALKAKYKPWALSASTRQDFLFMANWMLGQLNASHMGIRGGQNPEDLQDENTGLIGVEVEAVDNGVRITHVVPGSPAHREKSRLNVGDVITSVNGTPVTRDMNYYSTLTNRSGERVLLEIVNPKGVRREVVIEPVRSLRTELYEEYVDSRKKLVDEYSDGKLGYIHIQAMNYSSFERFERELKATGYGKDGIVIDVRWNGGGSTADLLMAVLNVQQHAYTVPRGAAKSLKEHTEFNEYYPLSRLPLSAWFKPSIAMSNETSYSNAEIFSHAFKNIGIGKLVGMPTFGAVISTGAAGLMDGSSVRMPFRGWFVKATGENMEHGPAVPDIIVQNEPDSKAKGEDPQLKRAVEELLKDL